MLLTAALLWHAVPATQAEARKRAHFGDISVAADTDDVERASVYASVDNAAPNHLLIVAINKADAPITADCAIGAKAKFHTAARYRLTAA